VMSMAQQVLRMRQVFPQFDVRFNCSWHTVWEGSVRPLSKTYLLKVSYTMRNRIGDMDLKPWFPQVWLVEPRLETRRAAPADPIPHLWPSPTQDPTRSSLCLFDPAQDEWSRDRAIADTTIPWAIDWLFSYEGWHATGEWQGGGREH